MPSGWLPARGRRLGRLGLLLALCVAPALSADVIEVRSAHYRLLWEGTCAEADTALTVLEAAYGEFEKFFGAAPKLAAGERLEIRYYQTHKGWVAGLKSHRIGVPATAGGYYWPPRKTVYLYRQPTVYYTRVLLIHEAAHQFHFLACADNRHIGFAWYVEGIAEFLGRHRWDGKRLELGVVPTLSLSDYAAKALALLEKKGKQGVDLPRLIDSRACPRPLAWALASYLATQAPKGFRALRAEIDRGASPGLPLRRHIGPADGLRDRLVAWLRKNQEPWAQVFNQWEGIGEGRIEGVAQVVSLCRLKDPVSRLSAELAVPARGWGGLLLHYSSRQEYTVALLNRRGQLRIDRRAGGRWQRLHFGPGAPAGVRSLKLVAVRAASGVWLQVGPRRFGPYDLPGRTFGLTLDSARVRFRNISWKR